jgi:cyclic-di-AMP phosphodiesterase PgpH
MQSKSKQASGFYRKFYYAFFLLITFAILYLLFPKQVTFKYEFQKGQPWSHETLIAPFDFPILKPKELLLAEKDSIFAKYIPFFTIEQEKQNEQLALLENQLESYFSNIEGYSSDDIKYQLINEIQNLYLGIYQRGIIEQSPELSEILAGKELVNLVSGNMVESVSVIQLLNLKSAYLLLSDTINSLSKQNKQIGKIWQSLDPGAFLVTNLSYDKAFNEMQIKEMQQQVPTTRGAVQAGVRVISEGDWVNNDNFLILESLKYAYERNRAYTGWVSTVIIGQMILVLIILSAMVLYLQTFNRDLFWKKRNFTMILFTVLAIIVLARLIYENPSLNLYMLPVCILPIIIRTFLGARMAFFIHFTTVLMISFMAPNSFEFFFLQAIAGIVAVVSLRKLHHRGQLVITTLYVFLIYCTMFIAFELIKEGTLRQIEWGNIKWFVANGLLLLSAYPLIYIIEKMFGFLSDVTLVELSDTNHPVLRKLAEIAPGTFQHSMQVANLAEASIVKIGGNPLLVRTGALYHDIGKINSSQYFIENQAGVANPHDKMSHLKSVEKIVGHVFDGVRMAKKYKLPEPIIDFIKMHHGTGLVKYFYLKYKEENPGMPVNEDDFKYPGPNPTSKETAVVMLADGVEAATRSLPEKNEVTLRALIDQIIDSKIDNHELDDAPVTFKDIKTIKEVFLEKLKNIYHLRIQYPKEESTRR